MRKVIIDNAEYPASQGENLREVLIRNGYEVAHPCGGTGRCRKCQVLVDGQPVLSCQYRIESDIAVQLQEMPPMRTEAEIESRENQGVHMEAVLDLGTTTLALAVINPKERQVVHQVTEVNAQCVFGADVISRIEYSIRHGVEALHSCITGQIDAMIGRFAPVDCLYVSGNATMLHILLGVSPDAMGSAPYTPEFLDGKTLQGSEIGLHGIKRVITLPSIAAFAGADIVAGMNCLPKPSVGKYHLLVDLGTNAEIVLYGEDKKYCTAAAAGPCFEGANISCGMSAVDGAICAYSLTGEAKTIAHKPAIGICGTGLIDVIACLLHHHIIDETGYMECETYEVAEGVFLTGQDVRQFQLAKAAIYAGILALMHKADLTMTDIGHLYISGGFSAAINTENAVYTGLLPRELEKRCSGLGNTSLMGTIKYVTEHSDLSAFIRGMEYVDLSKEEIFTEQFVENMMFTE